MFCLESKSAYLCACLYRFYEHYDGARQKEKCFLVGISTKTRRRMEATAESDSDSEDEEDDASNGWNEEVRVARDTQRKPKGGALVHGSMEQ
jgi:hypothetical protein